LTSLHSLEGGCKIQTESSPLTHLDRKLPKIKRTLESSFEPLHQKMHRTHKQ
jgi:hypothetical protein